MTIPAVPIRNSAKTTLLSAAIVAVTTLLPNIASATAATIGVCHGFGCAVVTTVAFTEADMAGLEKIVRAGKADADAERKALGKAVQWFEQRVGPIAGTSGDLGGYEHGYWPSPDQEDCIDESTNTTKLLTLIQKQGWLKFHTVAQTAERGFLLDGRYPHNTAVLVDTGTRIKWAVDSWTHSNAEPPDIMPLKTWLASGRRWFR